jgi:hypothetical protein
MRRKAFKDQVQDPAPRLVALTELCIIRACINRRIGPNLCADHTDELKATP